MLYVNIIFLKVSMESFKKNLVIPFIFKLDPSLILILIFNIYIVQHYL